MKLEQTNSASLPKESVSQEIGQHGVLTFRANYPLSWRPTETDGDEDAGLDFQVQVVENGQYQAMFNVQVKAGKQCDKSGNNKQLNSKGSHYSVVLKSSTLNYYARIENPILLVFSDLCQNPDDPRVCDTYYMWIDDELDSLLGDHSDLNHHNQESHTFHVPVVNKLTNSVNVLPYIAERIRRKRELGCLFKQLEEHVDDPLSAVSKIGSSLSSRVVLDTILSESDFPWMEPPKDTIAYELKQSSDYLKNNNFQLVLDCLEGIKADLEENSSEHEQAEYFYQKGSALSKLGDLDTAFIKLRKAHELCPTVSRYKIPYIESKLHNNYSNKSKCEEYLSEIQNEEGVYYDHLRIKLLSSLARFEEACEVVSRLEMKERLFSEPQILFLEGKYKDCVELCNKNLSEYEVKPQQELSIRILRSRSLFQLGAGKTFQQLSQNSIIPFSGYSDMDIPILRESWKELKIIWDIAEKANYPSNIEFIVDISSILGFLFDDIDILYSRLKLLSKTRYKSVFFQESLLCVAQQLNDREVIKKQLNILPDTTKNIISKILFKYEQGNKGDLLDLVIENMSVLLDGKQDNVGIALVFAAEAAHLLVRKDDFELIIKNIKELKNSESIQCIVDFLTNINENILEKSSALDKLYTRFDQGDNDPFILSILFDYLDPKEKVQAYKIKNISEHISATRGLYAKEFIKLCYAFATIGDWEGMLSIATSALNRFESNTRLIALKALALDELGRTGESLEILELVVSDFKDDPYPIQLYARIASRCGLTEKSKNLFESLLEQADTKEQKADIYRILFVLEIGTDPSSNKLLDYCMKYGNLINQEDEVEEGIFLMLFFGATSNDSVEPTEEQIEVFQKRLTAYSLKFPESKICRQVSFDPSENGEHLLEKFRELTGMTDEKLNLLKKNENLLKTGQLFLPYSIRPSHILNVSDIIYLWELTKHERNQLKQYQLLIATSDYIVSEIHEHQRLSVLVDDVTILFLYDLGLLELLFTACHVVAIAKNTLMRFQYWSQHVFVSPLANKSQKIIQLLSKHISNIKQPSCSIDSSMHISINDLDEYARIVNEENYIFYSDDILSRLYVCGDDYKRQSICTLELLDLLSRKSYISELEKAKFISTICGWNVGGVQIKFMYILRIAAIKSMTEKDVSSLVDSLVENNLLSNIFNYLWSINTNVDKALSDIGNFISLMLADEDQVRIENDTYVTAFWYIWFQYLQFHRDAGDRLNLLTNSLISVVIKMIYRTRKMSENHKYPKRLWSIYQNLLSYIYGDKMDDMIYEKSIQDLANQVTGLNDEVQNPTFKFTGAFFTEGTHDSELFNNTYLKSIIDRSKKK